MQRNKMWQMLGEWEKNTGCISYTKEGGCYAEKGHANLASVVFRISQNEWLAPKSPIILSCVVRSGANKCGVVGDNYVDMLFHVTSV